MVQEARILLVEDIRDWQIEIERILANQNYSISVANTLQKARDFLKHHTFELVLLDLRLEDWDEENFDGWNLMESLSYCRSEAGTQVIIITAYGLTDHVRDGFKKYKIYDYIDKKRIDPKQFRFSVAEAIKQAHHERDEIIGGK